ncbi:MAG: MG2 domain-containing protein [Gemmatimonadales bacterium]
MLAIRSGLLLLAAAVVADRPGNLLVIRTTPSQDAGPTAVVTVTFDRPVAGSLDQSVDPTTIVTVDPTIPGVWEWRDPVTLRLRPQAPLRSGTTYAVTVQPSFASLDGSRLAEPHRFAFRVSGPQVLASEPVADGYEPRFLTADQSFRLATGSPVDSAVVNRVVFVEPITCPRTGPIRLRLVDQRRITDSMPWPIREAGGWERDRSTDSLRRIVTLVPVEPLPLACRAALVVPSYLDVQVTGPIQRFPFETYGPLRLVEAQCGSGENACPVGPIRVRFSTPVRGAEVLRKVRILPKIEFTVSDTNAVDDRWTLWADLKPRTGYLVDVDPSLTDGFGQPLGGNPRGTAMTTGYAPDVSYLSGRLTVERVGPRTLPVTHVNVDTLEVITVAVPESLEARFLARSWYAWGDDWERLAGRAVGRKIAVTTPRDRHGVYGVPLSLPNVAPGTSPLVAVKVTNRHLARRAREDGTPGDDGQPIALVQVTDLGVHAKVGAEEAVVWVTGVGDGAPRSGAQVRLRDGNRRLLAQGVTNAEGIVRLPTLRRRPAIQGSDEEGEELESYVEVRTATDRALVGVNQYDPDLSPWQFNVSPAWGEDRIPAAAAVFTERGIYRPGDSVFAKAVVRTGTLGALKIPARTDSVRLVFHDRDGGELRVVTTPPSAFGTTSSRLRLPNDAPLGGYPVTVSLKRQGTWRELARAEYRVAEYRPPEFLVDVTADTAARGTGDTLTATVVARYLFGAPMARAKVSWQVRQRPVDPWEFTIPNTDGYFLTARGWWYEEFRSQGAGGSVSDSRVDSLDARGQLLIRAPLELANPTAPARVSVEAVVTDVNRQTVYGSAGVMVHPTAFYLGAKPTSPGYFWTANTSERVHLIAVTPTGQRQTGVAAAGVLIRREWHQVRRESNGYSELVGEWVSDTVDRCAVRIDAAGATCQLTPKAPGSYTVSFLAADHAGRAVTTSFYRWVTGPGWVPWADESRFKMDVVPDRSRYQVGDTATVLLASPFTNADAWVTIEREGLLEQRRIRLENGATTLKLPVTEAWAPNVFVGVMVSRGRSAPPGPLDDPGRPTIRVGYAEVRVTPERKRLAVTLAADRPEYRPGEEATITTRLADQGRGVRGEVTLWAVDEGVLSLTGYRTPDPIDLLYQPRGLGLRLGSNLATIAPQVAPGAKGRNPGGGGGDGQAEVLRSRFRTTAFFLGAVVTDSTGTATTKVKLPDNLTTFRVMAVAVTVTDRYGSGQSPLLVTRPLLARPALPRFVRPGDQFIAGVVVNHRTGGTPNVAVTATAEGIGLVGGANKSATLEAGRGREVRFQFRGEDGDSATFRFDVAGAGDRDAVRLAIPIWPATRPWTTTFAGPVTDSARVDLDFQADTDLDRSRVTVSLGSSPLALLKGYAGDLQVYPYYCSEQIAAVAAPLIALYRARRQAGAEAGDTVRLKAEIRQAVGIIERRQRDDGAIGLWSARDWSSPWLSAGAGALLLEARTAGIPVRDTVIAAIAGYLERSLTRQENMALSVAMFESERRASLGERLAVADFLSLAGRRNRSLENELLRQNAQLAPADRIQLGLVLARAGDLRTGRRLLEPFWRAARVEGRTVTLPDSVSSRSYFASTVRAPATLLLATLVVEPTHPLLFPLLETVVSRGRAAGPLGWWNTQDYTAAVRAVDAWQRSHPASERPTIRLTVDGRAALSTGVGRATGDSVVSLRALMGNRRGGRLSLGLDRQGGAGAGFYYLTVSEVPRTMAVNPEDRGFRVERWYEDVETRKPVTSAAEGDLVRVRLRITVAAARSFVVVDDPLPAGLEAIDLSLRTVGGVPGPAAGQDGESEESAEDGEARWSFGSWDSGWWSPFDHRELRDDRVVYSARALWPGTYTATYLARATTPGTFQKPQAHVEEMYNPAVFGRSDGGTFVVRAKAP